MSLPDNTFTVTELCQRVGNALTDAFPDEVWVQGAISGLSRSNNGHVYFDLVDPNAKVGAATSAVVPVALFASSRRLVNRILRRAGGIRMHDGIEIRIRGQLAYYPPQGRVQLVMSLIDPQFTLGQMAAARQQLMEQLSSEGILDRNHRLPFPALPLRVGLITSDQSAAYHDFVDELTASRYPFRITLVDTRVQGLDAVPGLAAALRLAATDPEAFAVDVVVVVRGGGARSDLTVFDHELVARAIATSPVPVIVGVGHETDRSVADEVAHTSLKTPTAAAKKLVDTVADFEARLDGAAHRVQALTHLHLDQARARLLSCGARLVTAARYTVDRHHHGLEQAVFRLGREPVRLLERAERDLDVASARLEAYDPARALRRGWTISYVDEGGELTLLRSPSQVTVGDNIRTVTADGTVSSVVSEVEPEPERDSRG